MKRLMMIMMTTAAALCFSGLVHAEQRFDRDVIKLRNPREYRYFRLADTNFPVLSSNNYSVSCLVYRGSQRYYVEVGISNRSPVNLTIADNFLAFTKPGYTVLRTDTAAAAFRIASDAGGVFIPTPPRQTSISGVAATTADPSAQAAANLGNAIGNAIAARSFDKGQSRESTFSDFLTSFAAGSEPFSLTPGETRLSVATFEQAQRKKSEFEITVRVGIESFSFKFKD